MKIIYKLLLGNIGLSFVIALLYKLSQAENGIDTFFVIFGITCLGVAGCDLFISIILFIAGKENREWAQGFLLSCGVLLLIGFAACTTAFQNMH
jgi:ABC-type Fe3+-siderophore transport system permease subunit